MPDNRAAKLGQAADLQPGAVVTSVTVETLRKLLLEGGQRVEAVSGLDGVPFLRSSVNGVGFDLRLGNRLTADANAAADFALVAVVRVEGELPLAAVNRWNLTRRFTRLEMDRSLLRLTMDVLVAGGVTTNNLRAQIEIWARIAQELVLYLRAELAKPAAVEKVPERAASASGSSTHVSA